MSYTQVWDHMTNSVSTSLVQRDSDGAFIPFDESNVDYREYLDWVHSGNIPKEPVKPTPPLVEVTPPSVEEVHAQVQDIDQRLTDLEAQLKR